LKVKKEVAMAITEKHTKGTPVSNMTLADLNRRNQQTYTADAPYAEELRRGMDPKEDQLRPGTTVHNSRGLTGKVVRVEGNRVVVRCPDGSQDQWDLRRTHEYAGDGLIPLPLTREGREQYRRGLEEKIVQLRKGVVRGQQPEDLANAEEQLKRLKATGDESTDSEGTEALREGVEEFLAEEEAEPEHQTDGMSTPTVKPVNQMNMTELKENKAFYEARVNHVDQGERHVARLMLQRINEAMEVEERHQKLDR
jgi:hypothetical protein